jgi:hypothetical protein
VHIARTARTFQSPAHRQSRNPWIGPVNILSPDQQVNVIAALTEGCSIRAVERLTDIHRDTIMRLGVRVGDGCAALHDRMMRDLHINLLEFDDRYGMPAARTSSTIHGNPWRARLAPFSRVS